MRLNDIRNGTDVVHDVLEKYKAAWEKKGMIGPGGLFKDMWLVKQDSTLPAMDPGFSAWSCAHMNTWNPKFVRDCYESQALGFLTTINGEARINPPVVGNAYRQVKSEDNAGAMAPEELMQKALELAQKTSLEEMAARSVDKPLSLFNKPILGYVVEWLSELGKAELHSLLGFIDNNLQPTWEKGGLYYPRNDEPMDAELNWTHMDPFSGNAAIGYARLNVEDGMKKVWDSPWTQEQVESQPWLDGVTMSDGIDFLRGTWDADQASMVVTMRSWDGSKKTVKPVFKNLPAGTWEIFVDGHCATRLEVNQDQDVDLAVEVEVGGADVDVVARRSS